ncbi:MAG: family 16 glycosylhydrolase [Bacteroidia bacterium]
MRNYLGLIVLLFCLPLTNKSQVVNDDFEGNGTITNWYGDACVINTAFANPYQQGINLSAKVLKYTDNGGLYANTRFQINTKFDLAAKSRFTLKIYVPASGLTGTQPNQVSLKLQDGSSAQPWETQSEIIKSIVLNQWQTISFDFQNDVFINHNAGSLPPVQRTDFDRVVIQVNGENNTDNVQAFIDDLTYEVSPPLVFNQLVWADEFTTNGAIDNTKWHHQTQLPASGSWYNGELQHYTNRINNSFVSNGLLNIVAKKETFTDQGHTKLYTSARLNSKFAFKQGRVEIRAKLPTGAGTWPALWMLGKNINENGAYWDLQGFGNTGWPACGEIDIMEHWGTNQNYVQSAMHTPSSSGSTVNLGGQTIPTASTAFHIYTLDWTSEKMVFKVDGVTHYVYNPAIKDADTWPFNGEQYLLLNIAIDPNVNGSFTQSTMEIDYVRVYQAGPSAVLQAENEAQVYYPNPVKEELTIHVENGNQQDVALKIYNMEGKLVKETVYPVENEAIHLTHLGDLAKGLYNVMYEWKGKPYHVKFLKD